MASWQEVLDFSQPLTEDTGGGGSDREVTSTPMRTAKILRLNEVGDRVMTPMRWGFAKRGGRGPHELGSMHARSETIDVLATFADSFKHRRGILPCRTFNEGEEVGKKTRQWVIRPLDRLPIAIAVIYEEWVNGDERIFTFVQVTTPANKLISAITDRMPAILPLESHALWLGEDRAPLEQVKAVLQSYDDGGGWTMNPQDGSTARPRAKTKPPGSPPAPVRPRKPPRPQGSLF